jgi:hypothetical protein
MVSGLVKPALEFSSHSSPIWPGLETCKPDRIKSETILLTVISASVSPA